MSLERDRINEIGFAHDGGAGMSYPRLMARYGLTYDQVKYRREALGLKPRKLKPHKLPPLQRD